jgi:hypothetical protein
MDQPLIMVSITGQPDDSAFLVTAVRGRYALARWSTDNNIYIAATLRGVIILSQAGQ